MSSPMSSAERRARRRDRGDQGMTLVELLLGVIVTGIMMSALGMSMIVILRTDKPTAARVTEARDVAFLQTYLPVDYSSAISRDTNPTAQPIAGQTLPGTNVLALVREERNGATVVTDTVSYRYVQRGVDWQLVRYEWGNPQHVGQLYRTIVAHELAAPPVGWTASSTPTHAVVVNPRTASANQPIGDDMVVTFKSGNSFSTGGSGLAAEAQLPSDYSGGTSDPEAVKSRCGGRVTLILDVSGSIGSVPNGPANVKAAANGFIDAFTGTPSDIGVIKFSDNASTVYPATYGTYFSVLTGGSAAITSAKAAVNAMPINGRTNWEDPIYNATRDGAGNPHTLFPEIVVLVTDGDPNRIRNSSSNQSMPAATAAAATAANYATARGARMIGILVGDAATRPASVDRLKQVVGSVAWNGTSATDIGNAAVAQYFLPPGGDFTKLGGVLKAVAAGECGGTVTVLKKIDDGSGNLSDSDRSWSYTSDVGVKALHPTDIAVTFDYTFTDNTGTKDAQIIEQPNSGYVLDRVECTSNGVALGSDRVTMLTGGTAGVKVKVQPNEAVSCTFISEAA